MSKLQVDRIIGHSGDTRLKINTQRMQRLKTAQRTTTNKKSGIRKERKYSDETYGKSQDLYMFVQIKCLRFGVLPTLSYIFRNKVGSREAGRIREMMYIDLERVCGWIEIQVSQKTRNPHLWEWLSTLLYRSQRCYFLRRKMLKYSCFTQAPVEYLVQTL